MSLSSRLSKDLGKEDVPEEVEHDLIKDSVLEIVNTDFKVNDDFDELPAGEIRKNICEDLSSEYQGKPVSRKSFSDRNWITDNTQSEDSLSNEDVSVDKLSDEEDKSDEDLDADSGGESYEELDGSDDDAGDEAKSDEEVDQSNEESAESEEEGTSKPKLLSDDIGINIFSSKIKNVDEDIKKGNSIKNQLVLWENLIECRIKLQKGLGASNRLMQKGLFAEFKSQLSPEEEITVNSTYKGLIDLLESLISLKDNLLKKCPEFKANNKRGKKNVKSHNSDEEITSSESENEKEIEIEFSSEEENPPEKKRKTIDDYSEYLQNSSNKYKTFRDTVIQKWNDKTRLASGKVGISKFAILEQSTLKQIEQILLDKDRLLKRTQIRRSKLPVLGKEKKQEDENENKEDNDEEETVKKEEKEDLDCEIFDDDDFYHKLLKDFIDRKTSDVTDPTQLGRQWTKLQKLRSKMKRKIDTRATKGRKIRYTVHNKLVNFMAPVPYSTWDDKVEQDLFRSLFGQASQAVPAQGQ